MKKKGVRVNEMVTRDATGSTYPNNDAPETAGPTQSSSFTGRPTFETSSKSCATQAYR